jgi:two-component system chemotaxis sensor kinase CheA
MLHSVRETLLVAPDAIQTMQQGEVLFVRDVALPVRRLHDWLQTGYESTTADTGAASGTGVQPAIVVRRAGRDEVLMVDELAGKQQVVIKPLSPYLGTVPGVEGSAILPDGSVTLILDVEGLAD